MISNFDHEKFARDAGFASWADRQQAIRRNRERLVKAQAWRDAGCPGFPPYGLTPDTIRAARQYLGCDDDWPIDTRWHE